LWPAVLKSQQGKQQWIWTKNSTLSYLIGYSEGVKKTSIPWSDSDTNSSEVLFKAVELEPNFYGLAPHKIFWLGLQLQ